MVTAVDSPMYWDPTSKVAVPTVIRAIGGAPKNWMAIGSFVMARTVSGCRSQCMPTTTINATSSSAASSQATVATTARPGMSTGRIEAATAMTPVPMTDANQLGPSTTRPSMGDDRTPAQRSKVLPSVSSRAAMLGT